MHVQSSCRAESARVRATKPSPLVRRANACGCGALGRVRRRGTDNNGAVQKLLSFAVSDVSHDVRRAAVMCLGFVLMGVPQQCPRIVALLAESFNPHVR
jgi:hypothetical protein